MNPRRFPSSRARGADKRRIGPHDETLRVSHNDFAAAVKGQKACGLLQKLSMGHGSTENNGARTQYG